MKQQSVFGMSSYSKNCSHTVILHPEQSTKQTKSLRSAYGLAPGEHSTPGLKAWGSLLRLITTTVSDNGLIVKVKNGEKSITMDEKMNLAIKTNKGWETIRRGSKCGEGFGIDDLMPENIIPFKELNYFLGKNLTQCINGKTITQTLPAGNYLIYFYTNANGDTVTGNEVCL